MNPPDAATPCADPADPDPLAGLRNEFFRRMGRNVWFFQHIELLLKQLVLASGLAARPDEFVARLMGRQQAIRGKTFGTLAGELFTSLVSDGSQPVEADDPEAMSVRLRLQLDARQAEALRVGLAALVKERNELVHHAFEHWSVHSKQAMEAALIELESQRERILHFRSQLQPLCEGVALAGKSAVEYVQSEAFTEALHASSLQTALIDSVQRAARADGWAPVARAGQVFAEHRRRLLEANGSRLPGLQRLLQQSGLFELREEAARAGSQMLCRLRPQDLAENLESIDGAMTDT